MTNLSKKEFLQKFKEDHIELMIDGLDKGWWDIDLDHNGELYPIKKPTTFSILNDFSNIKTPLMAHAMAKAEIFSSVGQARKNGWDKPMVTGEWTVTKKKIRIKIVD